MNNNNRLITINKFTWNWSPKQMLACNFLNRHKSNDVKTA